MTKQSIKRVSNCICFYCICRGARVGLRRGFHRHGCVTAHVSRNSAHDGEGEGKRGLVTVVHRVNYTIFAAGSVGFRGRFPWLRKVSVVRREQIRVLNQNRTPASASALRTTFGRGICVIRRATCRANRRGLSTFQPFNFSTCLTAAQTAAESAALGGVVGVDVHVVEREIAGVDGAFAFADAKVDHDLEGAKEEIRAFLPHII